MIQKRQIKPKEPIPQFKNTREEAEFWDTHDVGEYLNRIGKCIFPVSEVPITQG